MQQANMTITDKQRSAQEKICSIQIHIYATYTHVDIRDVESIRNKEGIYISTLLKTKQNQMTRKATATSTTLY